MNPGDTGVRVGARARRWSTLNEGRGMNPGDTRKISTLLTVRIPYAQRRPGHEPRRHPEPAR